MIVKGEVGACQIRPEPASVTRPVVVCLRIPRPGRFWPEVGHERRSDGMAGYGARERDGGDRRDPFDAAARDALREGWAPPVARIERGADGRVRIRLNVGAAGRRSESGNAPP